MNLSQLFKTEEERNEAINHLTSLSKNPNWKFLVEKIIKPDIENISNEILDTIFKDLEEEKDLKRKRAYWIILSQLPEKMIEALKENKSEVLQFDPYFKDTREIKED